MGQNDTAIHRATEAPTVWIEQNSVKQDTDKMKCAKAARPSSIIADMLTVSEMVETGLVTGLVNSTVHSVQSLATGRAATLSTTYSRDEVMPSSGVRTTDDLQCKTT